MNSCENVVKHIAAKHPEAKFETLRDCTWEQLEEVRAEVGEEDYSRAHFVLGEKDRVLAVCDASESGYETKSIIRYSELSDEVSKDLFSISNSYLNSVSDDAYENDEGSDAYFYIKFMYLKGGTDYSGKTPFDTGGEEHSLDYSLYRQAYSICMSAKSNELHT